MMYEAQNYVNRIEVYMKLCNYSMNMEMGRFILRANPRPNLVNLKQSFEGYDRGISQALITHEYEV